MARIYSITVSNAVDGVSSGCQACALSTERSSSTCVPCPAGHYIDTRTSQCTECQRNTYLVSHATLGPETCKPCGPASKSDKVCWCFGMNRAILFNFFFFVLYTCFVFFFVFYRITVFATVTVTSHTQRAT